jgi:hypothetical protein
MKFRAAIVGGALICVVVFATVWVIRITRYSPGASNGSPQASSASEHPISSPSRINSFGPEKVHRSPPEAVPNTRQPAINPSATLPSFQGSGRMPMDSKAKRFDPTAWIRELPEEKRGQVRNAFAEHAACVRERSRSLTRGEQDKQIDEETRQRIWEDCDHGLKSTLGAVLSAEEYKQFLSSLPSALATSLEELTVPILPE